MIQSTTPEARLDSESPRDPSLEAGAASGGETGAAETVSSGSGDTSPDGALLALVLSSLEEDKAEDVLAIDLRGKSAIADHMVIASGRSSRHVASICEKLIERIKATGSSRPRAEGLDNGDWALIDAGDVVVHVFRPEVREYYALEKMWAPADAQAARRPSATTA